MEEEMIEVVVRECDSKINDFPDKESKEGKMMVETIIVESINEKDTD